MCLNAYLLTEYVFECIPTDRIYVFECIPTDRISVFECIPTDRIYVFESIPTDRISVFECIPTDRISVFECIPTDRIRVGRSRKAGQTNTDGMNHKLADIMVLLLLKMMKTQHSFLSGRGTQLTAAVSEQNAG
jgi:hypothetical protein